MKVLAIDTASWVASAGVWEDGCELSFGERDQEKGQAALLPELVTEVIAEHKIDQIIVNLGPGSFTGIRLGLAFAKGLAMGWDLPLKGLDSFMITYLGLEANDDVLILIEARRQDVYARHFQSGIPQIACSLDRNEIERIASTSDSISFAGNGLNILAGTHLTKKVSSPLRGAQCLAHAFFKDPLLFVDPSPFYVREADITLPAVACSSLG